LSRLRVLWNQLRSPLLLLLVFAAGASAVTGEWVDAVIVLAILLASAGIGYSREYRAQAAADELRARVRARATVLRDGRPVTIPLREVFFAATPEVFRTGWFVESLLTELVIALVVRTRRPFFQSRPGTLLLASTLGILALTFVIPFLPFAGLLDFAPLPGSMLATLIGITVLYVAATELAKARFYRGAP